MPADAGDLFDLAPPPLRPGECFVNGMHVQSLLCASGDAFDSDDDDGVFGDLEDDGSGDVSSEQQGTALGDGGSSKDGAPTSPPRRSLQHSPTPAAASTAAAPGGASMTSWRGGACSLRIRRSCRA